jgi:hypothetical protein
MLENARPSQWARTFQSTSHMIARCRPYQRPVASYKFRALCPTLARGTMPWPGPSNLARATTRHARVNTSMFTSSRHSSWHLVSFPAAATAGSCIKSEHYRSLGSSIDIRRVRHQHSPLRSPCYGTGSTTSRYLFIPLPRSPISNQDSGHWNSYPYGYPYGCSIYDLYEEYRLGTLPIGSIPSVGPA